MRRICLTIQYDGTNYVGWQRQINGISIQEMLEKALQKAEGRFVTITGASRTDAGVHALGQRAHFDTESRIPVEKYPYVFNTMLPRDISVVRAEEMAQDFHARFDAKRKTYLYRFDNQRHRNALFQRYSAHVPLPLDEALMQKAANDLIGEHDFAAFAASGSVAKTTVRTVYAARIDRMNDMVTLTVQGNGFLYNMVRIVAGTLVLVGQHRMPEDVFCQAYKTRDRRILGPTAVPEGLTLCSVDYGG